MSRFFSVIIVNYNAGARLAACLDRLRHQTFTDFETIVIDNGSGDGSQKAAAATPGVKLIEAGENLGFAAANNRAAREARGDWLAFLNPDAYAAPDWLEAAAEGVKRYRDVDSFGSTQLAAENDARIDGAGDAYHAFGAPYRGHHGWPSKKLPPEGECFAACAAAGFMRRSVFESLGGFDESFFCYVEDIDLGFRLRLAGGRAVQLRDAVVRHEGSGITGRNSEFTIFHGHRNRVWTHVMNMPLPLLLATAPFHILTNLYLLARLTAVGSGGAYLNALRAALTDLPRVLRKRRERQRGRAASTLAIARALTWSPVKIARKEADIRVYEPT